MRVRGTEILFALLAVVQLTLLVRRGASVLPHLERQNAVLEGRREDDPKLGFLSLQAQALRDVRSVLPALPERGRVLVLTTNPLAVRYDYLLLPRDAHLLVDAAEGFLEQAAALRPKHARIIRERLEDIRRLEQDSTPERLARELEAADAVLLFDYQGVPPIDGAEFETVAESGLARVLLRTDRESGH
jgi:hypothetical protein